MKKKIFLPFLLLSVAMLLAGCNYENKEDRTGFFYNVFVAPMDSLIHWLGPILGHNYGLTIIVITLVVRLALFPLMMNTYKSQAVMREKMALVKPEMERVQKKVKVATTQEEKMEAQQEMMALYKKHNINPLNMGCLPMLIQMPIVLGLYYALRFPTEGGITEYPNFLWMNLTEPDILITLVAGIAYAVQAWISLQFIPEEQKQQMKIMMLISPIMIMWISFISPSALALYWAVGGIFIVFQTWLGNKFYRSKSTEELAESSEELTQDQAEEIEHRKNTEVRSKKKKKRK
ncbi:membrane protein insertase YidC [Abyssicoccus albus]|uniref:Membrane protein insertase YidC n=1 Tax=Abyssicoccus albus TaxID=1817405 RepID=A0A3N5CG76_9BACL|nr:membrane protein insertase YidC [Abyssicoccus albus]RPF56421.1 YidC/Oxa1 family membrane protein insertase [Abyssicoccus albus]